MTRTRLERRRAGSMCGSLFPNDAIVNVAMAAESEAAAHASHMQAVWPFFAEPLFVLMSKVCKTWRGALAEHGFDTMWRGAFTLRFAHLLERWHPHLPADVSYRSLYQAAVSAHGLLYIKELGGLSQAPTEYVVLKYGAPADYMRRQRHINAAMRAILIDWLVTVVDDFKHCGLDSHVLFRAVGLLDRYLASRPVKKSTGAGVNVFPRSVEVARPPAMLLCRCWPSDCLPIPTHESPRYSVSFTASSPAGFTLLVLQPSIPHTPCWLCVALADQFDVKGAP